MVNCCKRFHTSKSDKNATREELFNLEEFRKTLDLNVTCQIIVTDIVSKLLIENGGGSIINISSIYGLLSLNRKSIIILLMMKGLQKPLSYSVSKSALFNLTRHLGTLWAKNNIRVNTVTFGGVENNQDKEFIKKYSKNVRWERWLIQMIILE